MNPADVFLPVSARDGGAQGDGRAAPAIQPVARGRRRSVSHVGPGLGKGAAPWGRRPAFSLVELMIAVGILATALLLVVGIFVNVSRASQKSIDLTAGTVIAESYIAKELYNILNDEDKKTAFFSGSSTYNSRETPFASGTARLNQTVFVYNLYAVDITPSGSSTPYPEDNRMKLVDCVVWWWQEKEVEEGAEAGTGTGGSQRNFAQGYGFLRAEVSRLVNEGSGF